MSNGQLRVLDAKVSFDDNALYRHPDVVALRDETEEDAKEIEASKYDLNDVTLEAISAAWSTAPALRWRRWTSSSFTAWRRRISSTSAAAPPRNRVTAAFKIITADPNVKGILVNIFGGIMKCDVIAEGVVAAVKEVGLKVPLVVRLEGTNVDAGKKIIRDSGLNVLPADDLDDAAQKIVKAVRGAEPMAEHARLRRTGARRGARKLAVFAGEWTGEGDGVSVDRWTVGEGRRQRSVTARIDLNGSVSDPGHAHEIRDGEETFATHGVFTYDREDRLYKHSAGTNGLRLSPPSPAARRLERQESVLVRGSLRGNARHVYEVIDADSYTMKIQFSPDAEGWADVLTGAYRRTGVTSDRLRRK